MPLEIERRCGRCHRIKKSTEFPVLRIDRDRRGKKHRVYDLYCRDCRPYITPRQRLADTRDLRPADR